MECVLLVMVRYGLEHERQRCDGFAAAAPKNGGLHLVDGATVLCRNLLVDAPGQPRCTCKFIPGRSYLRLARSMDHILDVCCWRQIIACGKGEFYQLTVERDDPETLLPVSLPCGFGYRPYGL